MRSLYWLVALAALACGSVEPTEPPSEPVAPPVAATAPLPMPTDSLYNLQPRLVDQHGQTVGLDVHRGHPVIVSMFYASCPSACPMLIDEIRALQASLPAGDREALRVLLVSLDPERDTPELLAGVVRKHEIDDARWTLARAEPADVRAIAAALGIRYRPTTDGEMNHASVKTLLDVDGRLVARLEGLGRDPAPLRDALARASQPAAAR